jgi:hypothetical protein
MSLLKTVKKIVFLAPVRCGRTFYAVDIVETANKISVRFTPTDEYLMLDPRRENEAFMPEHIHLFEKWQHIGLAVGSLRYFLTENNISHTWVNTTDGAEIIMDRVDQAEYIGIEKQEKLKHAHRTFNPEIPVDAETEQLFNSMIDEFLTTNNGHKIVVTDSVMRKKLAALAVYWGSQGDVNAHIRPPQMNTTPMMISVPAKDFDINYWFNMGALYATIGLTALARGYQVAYCNAFNMFDPRVARVEDLLQVKFGTYTTENVPPRPWICIGKALDPSKPHNWVGVENRYEDDIMITCILTTKDYIKVITQEEHV